MCISLSKDTLKFFEVNLIGFVVVTFNFLLLLFPFYNETRLVLEFLKYLKGKPFESILFNTKSVHN